MTGSSSRFMLNQSRNAVISLSTRGAAGASKWTRSLPIGPDTTCIGPSLSSGRLADAYGRRHQEQRDRGGKLDAEQVRSSIARRLGMDIGALNPADSKLEGVVEMMLDVTRHYDQPLTAERRFA